MAVGKNIYVVGGYC